MTMPLLPGLMGAKAAPAGPAAAPSTGGMPLRLADLTQEQFDSLLAASKGTAPTAPPAEGEEGEPEEVDEEAQAKAEAETIAGVANACNDEVQTAFARMEELEKLAGESEDGDPKAIKKLLKEAKGVAEDCADAAEKAMEAVEDADVKEATKQSELCEGFAVEMKELLAQAEEAAGSVPAAAATPSPAPAAPAAAPKNPLDVWLSGR